MVRLAEFASVASAALIGAAAFFAWHAIPSASTTDHPTLARDRTLIVAEAIAEPPREKIRALPPHLLISGGPELPASAIAQAPLPPEPMSLDPATESEMAQGVAARLAAKVPETLTPYFNLYFYVSKAASGPWAQRLFVFHKNDAGALVFEESFPVSTGRERSEQYFTATPMGFFELDRARFIPLARSAKWNDALMPWAMFLNYAYREKMSGVALHAAIGRHELADIGHRASGGCVRLPFEKAKALFHRIQATMSGQVPVFTFDDTRGTTNTAGEMLRDTEGNIMVADGYKVLVVIENYAGSKSTHAPST